MNTKCTWKASKDDDPSPSYPEAEEVSSNLVVCQMCTMLWLVVNVLQRKLTADAHFNEARVIIALENPTPEHKVYLHSLSRIHPGPIQAYPTRELTYLPKDDMWMTIFLLTMVRLEGDNLLFTTVDLDLLQSLIHHIIRSPLSLLGLMVWKKCLKLLHRRRTSFSIPGTSESPKKTYGVTGGTPPPRDDPIHLMMKTLLIPLLVVHLILLGSMLTLLVAEVDH